MKKLQYCLLIGIPLAIFVLWTILVKTVDVAYVNQIGYLGFYKLNTTSYRVIASFKTDLFKTISDVLLYLSFASILPFAIVGVKQLITRKSLAKVDRFIYVALGAYVVTVICYFIFEIVEINAGPTSTPEHIKQSYPSSHIFLSLSFLGVALFGVDNYFKNKRWVWLTALISFAVLLFAIVASRYLSGMHYFTDVVGAILLADFILMSTYAAYRYFVGENQEEQEEQPQQ